MNEDDISQRVRENIPKPAPQTETPPVVEEPGERGFIDDIGDNTNIYRLYDYFNVEPSFRNGDTEQKLQVIYRWAADKVQSTDYLAVINVLTNYSQGMGVGSLDNNNLTRMYEYIQLDRQMEHLRQEQGLLYQ